MLYPKVDMEKKLSLWSVASAVVPLSGNKIKELMSTKKDA